MALERVGLKAVFETAEFSQGQKIYEAGTKKSNALAKDAARQSLEASRTMTAGWQSAARAAGLLATAAIASFGLMKTAWNLANEAMEKRGLETSAGRIEEAWAKLRFELGSNLIPVIEDLGDAAVTMIGKLEVGVKTFGDLLAKTHANIAGLRAYSQVMMAAGESEEKFAGSIWAHRYQLGKALTDQEKMVELQERQKRASEAAAEAYEKTTERYAEATKPLVEVEAVDYEKAAQKLQAAFSRIEQLHEKHVLALQRKEEDAARARARAWAQYGRQVEKAVKANAERLDDIAERYEKKREKTLRDAEKAIAKAEADVRKDRLRQQADFERQERQQRERFQLDRLQSERRYQYNWARTLAEGDALALYYLQQEHDLEQQEARENEELRRKQAGEGQTAQIREAGEAAREQIAELREQLQEQLAEQETNYREQIEKQKEADAERLAEMAVNFAEQQALRDEDAEIARQRQEEDYQRQLRALGRSLADQEELQEIGAEGVRRLLERYWSESGENELIMEGFHRREQERISVTSGMLRVMAEAAAAMPAMPTPEFHPVYGMQHGGVLRGPAYAYIEPGMVEASSPWDAEAAR